MRVLYATDGRAAAIDARRLIELLGDREQVDVTVASVIVAGPPELRHLSSAFRSHSALRKAAEDAVDDAVTSLRAAEFTADGVVQERRPADTLLWIATEHDADLIVVGSGVRWLGGRLLGDVSTSLLRMAPMSVLVVHEAPRTDDAHVVVGVDGSDHALRALDVAAEFLDPRRCAVTVVAAAKLMAPTLTPPFTAHATTAPSAEVEAEVLAPAREHADRAVGRLTAAGFTADTHVVLGHPVKRLLAQADHVGAALTVVGSRGLDGLDRAMLGSVSDQVVRFAPATLVGR